MSALIERYKRRANYYETDRMMIVHHSNYIRYFEEARIDFMHKIGCDVLEMENMGLIIPNVDAYARYKKLIHFFDDVEIEARLVTFTGSRMLFEYVVYFEGTDEIAAVGHTTHCFTNTDMKPVSIRKSHPDLYQKMKDNVSESNPECKE